MKRTVGKVNRSGVYYLMTTVAPANDVRHARLEIWGTVTVIILLLGAAAVMRLVLTM